MDQSLEQQLRDFIIDNFLFGDTSRCPAPQNSLLGKGVIDSTGVLELVNYLQENFGITVMDEEMIPENLDTIQNLVGFIRRKSAPVDETSK
jgi:acyl carrier protein